jgi:uncharacterized protein YggE
VNIYPFIEAEKARQRNVKRACELLKVSRAAYYAARGGRPSDRDREDAELTVLIRAEHKRSKGRYGAPRIEAELRRKGRRHSRKRIARLMRQHGLRGRAPKRWKKTTIPDPAAAARADAIRPGQEPAAPSWSTSPGTTAPGCTAPWATEARRIRKRSPQHGQASSLIKPPALSLKAGATPVLACVLSPQEQYAMTEVPTEPVAILTASGEAAATAKGDTLTLTLSCSADAKTSAAALSAAEAAWAKVTEIIDQAGVPANARLNSGVSVNRWREFGQQKWIEKGWRASARVRLRLPEGDGATQLIARTSEAAGAVVLGTEWEVHPANPARADAVRGAVALASSRARELAEASGVRLGRLIAIRDVRPDRFAARAAGALGAGDGAPEIGEGWVDVQALVELDYEFHPDD